MSVGNELGVSMAAVDVSIWISWWNGKHELVTLNHLTHTQPELGSIFIPQCLHLVLFSQFLRIRGGFLLTFFADTATLMPCH